MISENSVQIVRWAHFPAHCELVPLRLLYFDWRLISETSVGEQDKQYHKDSPRFETEPGVSDRLNAQHGDQTTSRVADAMDKHCEENTLTGMIEKPRPEKSQCDKQARIRDELRQVEWTFQDRPWDEVNR